MRRAPSPTPNRLPSNTLPDSITRGSMTGVELAGRGERGGRLLRPLQRRGPQVHDVALGDRVGDALGHLPAERGEVVPVAAAVEHALGVVHLTVSQQVDDGRVSHGFLPGGGRCLGGGVRLLEAGRRGPSARPARRARRRRTTPRTPTAAGRRRGRASRGRTRRRRRCPGRWAAAKSRTGPSVKKTENMVPADCTQCGTPASDSASVAASLIVVPTSVEVGVDVVGREAERGQAGGGRDRVPREGACLVDRPLRREHPPSGRPGRRRPPPGSRRPSPCRRSSGRGSSPRPHRRGPTRPAARRGSRSSPRR